MNDIKLWSNGTIKMPLMNIPVLDIRQCRPEMWKAVACALQIKPCYSKSRGSVICKCVFHFHSLHIVPVSFSSMFSFFLLQIAVFNIFNYKRSYQQVCTHSVITHLKIYSLIRFFFYSPHGEWFTQIIPKI